ncbi:hypothetical protein BASA81_000490 [Batrachochytrium salamandrivorans]|nr:hypothetical protein BASA81_000490 [Batrachochytrium salamandrivorans]
MNSDLYRALAAPQACCLNSDAAPGASGPKLLRGASADLSKNKTSPPLPAPATGATTSLDRFLDRFVQPHHCTFAGLPASKAFALLSSLLRELAPGVQVVKENATKLKFACSAGSSQFKLKLTEFNNVVVLELVVLSPQDEGLNAWGEMLNKLVADRGLCEHVVVRPKPLLAAKPLFAVPRHF